MGITNDTVSPYHRTVLNAGAVGGKLFGAGGGGFHLLIVHPDAGQGVRRALQDMQWK